VLAIIFGVTIVYEKQSGDMTKVQRIVARAEKTGAY